MAVGRSWRWRVFTFIPILALSRPVHRFSGISGMTRYPTGANPSMYTPARMARHASDKEASAMRDHTSVGACTPARVKQRAVRPGPCMFGGLEIARRGRQVTLSCNHGGYRSSSSPLAQPAAHRITSRRNPSADKARGRGKCLLAMVGPPSHLCRFLVSSLGVRRSLGEVVLGGMRPGPHGPDMLA